MRYERAYGDETVAACTNSVFEQEKRRATPIDRILHVILGKCLIQITGVFRVSGRNLYRHCHDPQRDKMVKR